MVPSPIDCLKLQHFNVEVARLPQQPEPEFVNLLRSPGIDFQPGETNFFESIPWLLKRLQIRAQLANPSEPMGSERHRQEKSSQTLMTTRKQGIIDQTQPLLDSWIY